MRGRLADTLDLLLDIVYPRDCLLCAARITGQPLRGVCRRCLERAGWQEIRLCPRCSAPQGEAAACRECAGEQFAFEAVWSFGRYEGDLRRLIHAFKFERDKGVGRDIAQHISCRETLRAFLGGCDALIPVPLHPLKEKDRGFNQARILAQEIARAIGKDFLGGVLLKCRTSVPQTELDRRARWKNVSGTFALANAERIKGARLVLVDDVMTTGATAHHCARLLREAGAGRVNVLVVARA